VIPAYNEEASVGRVVQEVSRVAGALDLDHEIVVVNDGSRDRTGQIVRGLIESIPPLRLVEHYPNRGYGGSLKAGFAAAKGDLIAFIPGDGQFDFSEICLFLEHIERADIVCGYRANRQDAPVRKLFAFGWNSLVRLLFGYLCRDIDCGFKLLRREILEHVNLVSDGAMIDTEMLAGARARGFRIAEVPVTHLPRAEGAATGGNFKVIVKAFRDLVDFRLQLTRETRAERQQAQEVDRRSA